MPPTATRKKGKKAPEPEVVVVEEEIEEIEDDEEDEDVDELDDDEDTEDEDDDDDLDELEEAEPEPPAKPAKKTKGKAAKTTTATVEKAAGPSFNTAWLAEYVTIETGKPVDGRQLRVLLRRYARDESNTTFTRDIGGDRARYDFAPGAKNPLVKTIIADIKGGALERQKGAGLEAANKARAAKKAAKAAAEEAEAAKPATKTKKAKAPAATPAKATKTKKRKAATDDE